MPHAARKTHDRSGRPWSGRSGSASRSDGGMSDPRYLPPAIPQLPPIVLRVGGNDVGTWRDGARLCAADSPISGMRLDADLARRSKRARSRLLEF